MIPITKPFLPPKEEYLKYVEAIWERNWLTNNGPLVKELENNLLDYLNVKNILYVSNGTIAIQLAIKALGLTGEIITTPFSYVATTSSIVWEGCKPVFVDIDNSSYNIDHNKIESAITEKTTAIIATHVFGNPCEIKEIKKIADKYNLKIIYDAAHAFGVTYNGNSIFEYGDLSVTSFHATKLFHTIEGGAVFTNDLELERKVSLMRNFGHTSTVTFKGVGINGKSSEFHAAMGLVNLNYVEEILQRKKNQALIYDRLLDTLKVKKQQIHKNCNYNYSYYPILFENEKLLLESIKFLNKKDIFPRRYFYPSLSSLDYVSNTSTPISDDISSRILCLPLYHDLSEENQELIARLLLKAQNNSISE